LLFPAFKKHTTQAQFVQNKYKNLMPSWHHNYIIGLHYIITALVNNICGRASIFVANPTLYPISFSTVCIVPQGMQIRLFNI